MNDLLTPQLLQKQKDQITPSSDEMAKLDEIIQELDSGVIRSANCINNKWEVNITAKQAISCYLALKSSQIRSTPSRSFDKVPLKFDNWTSEDFVNNKLRVVPGAIVRYGSYVSAQCVLMPSFVNMGAYIGEKTMIDTYASIGSCAQIGASCHISAGAGIGGVLEPESAMPTIIEDNCFIGARSEIVDGVIVREGSVIAMGTFISPSTKIYNAMTEEITYGEIPPYSVVIPGSLPRGKVNISCAVIVKKVTQSTREKTSINELLR